MWQKFLVGFSYGACFIRQCCCGIFIVTKPGCYYHFWWEGDGVPTIRRKSLHYGVFSSLQTVSTSTIFRFPGILKAPSIGLEGSPDSTLGWSSHSEANLSAHLLQSHLHEQNLIADMLSKRGVDSAPGAIHSAAFNHDFRTDSLIFLLQFLNRHLYLVIYYSFTVSYTLSMVDRYLLKD